MTEYYRVFDGQRLSQPGPMLFGQLRIVESSHRGLSPWGYSHMVNNLYVGRDLFEALKNG